MALRLPHSRRRFYAGCCRRHRPRSALRCVPVYSMCALPTQTPTTGATAITFVSETYNVQPGDVVLVHTVAGGLGLLFAQLIKARGGTVIGTTSTPEKAALAKAHELSYTGMSRYLPMTGMLALLLSRSQALGEPYNWSVLQSAICTRKHSIQTHDTSHTMLPPDGRVFL